MEQALIFWDGFWWLNHNILGLMMLLVSSFFDSTKSNKLKNNIMYSKDSLADSFAYNGFSKTIEINTVKQENQRTIIQSLNGICFFNEDWMNEEDSMEEVDLESVSI